MSRFDVQVQFITYGDASDRNWENELPYIKILPIYERLNRPKSKILAFLQTLVIPWVFRNELRQTDLLKTNQIWGGWVAVLSKWVFRKPLLVRCGYEYHDFCQKQGASRIYLIIVYWMSKFIYQNADLIHVAAQNDKKIIHKNFKIDKRKINVRPNWINTDAFKPYPAVKKERILFVGRLNQQKNISLLLNAISTTGIGLDIYGAGEESDKIVNIANKINVDVNFMGRATNDKMPAIYNQYPIYVLCSKYEGNPKTLLEAMSCGCAVIGTEVPGIREIIIDGENGLLVPGNVTSLNTAIRGLLANKSLCQRLGANAREYIMNNNSMDHAINKEYAVYQQLKKH
jgi:glycosyltransferase involved in cell wall biosynthesis